jgi:hypothetical protein
MLFGVWNDIPRCGDVNNTGSLWREFPILLYPGELTSFESLVWSKLQYLGMVNFNNKYI